MRRILFWLLALGAAAVVVFLVQGAGITARRAPWPLEAKVARASWRFLVPADVRAAANPVPATAEGLRESSAHWADHCAVCHGNDGSGLSTIGRRVFPPTPDIRDSTTQNLTDGELFYAIEQGIPWTAMPAWSNGTAEGERESWALVRFIRHLPSLTPEELKEMDRFKPVSPAELQREREIDDFLNGPPRKGSGQGREGSR
jgi:mono/diheme cytochrome c family protein